MPERVAVVEDDRELRAFLAEVLEDAGYEAAAYPGADAALREIRAGKPVDLVVTDLVLPGMRGHELLRELREQRPELNVIVITAFGSIESAIELVKAGAYDYVTKPFGTDEFLLTVERALQESRLRREVAALSRAASAVPPGFVGASRPMQELFAFVFRVAATRYPTLITGESGTGKELVARALHELSGRVPFVAVNCAALPEQLLESELFGHEKGAFTGADRDKPGLFETAHAGTLFLDEITELPAALQPKLLRALENGEVRRVGATRARNLDVRVVAATNKEPEEEVRRGRLREDLFWRLNVVSIHVPPLRERPADIPLLAEHFLERTGASTGSSTPVPAASAASPSGAQVGDAHPWAAPRLRIAPDAMALLTAYPWPGNVRELRNAIERAAALVVGPEIRPEDLPPRIREAGRVAVLVADASQRQISLSQLERAYILEILRQTGGNKSRAAEILGLDRKTLYRKLEEYRVKDVESEG
ncbi:MAG: sigma-54-dependent Fis family transcriptional regulator [Gemmatimonadetes bacterium]|nr:sigma-54-dependent Fis family transcriptional regulator [Gemmatimonadota bacterium]